jgi:hypothetical protein
MSYEITGSILEIYPEQQFASGFSKREFVITTRDKYPQCVKLEFTKEKCAQLDDYQPGDPVTVHFNIRGNEWQNRYFVNLQAWKIAPDGGAAAPGDSADSYPPAHAAALPAKAPAAAAAAGFYDDGEDDGGEIPF